MIKGNSSRPEEGRGEGSAKRRPRRTVPRSVRLRQWMIMACLVAVCALAAFLFVVFRQVTVTDAASFLLFGTSDPCISPERGREMQKEFKDMIQKEFGARKAK